MMQPPPFNYDYTIPVLRDLFQETARNLQRQNAGLLIEYEEKKAAYNRQREEYNTDRVETLKQRVKLKARPLSELETVHIRGARQNEIIQDGSLQSTATTSRPTITSTSNPSSTQPELQNLTMSRKRIRLFVKNRRGKIDSLTSRKDKEDTISSPQSKREQRHIGAKSKFNKQSTLNFLDAEEQPNLTLVEAGACVEEAEDTVAAFLQTSNAMAIPSSASPVSMGASSSLLRSRIETFTEASNKSINSSIPYLSSKNMLSKSLMFPISELSRSTGNNSSVVPSLAHGTTASQFPTFSSANILSVPSLNIIQPVSCFWATLFADDKCQYEDSFAKIEYMESANRLYKVEQEGYWFWSSIVIDSKNVHSFNAIRRDEHLRSRDHMDGEPPGRLFTKVHDVEYFNQFRLITNKKPTVQKSTTMKIFSSRKNASLKKGPKLPRQRARVVRNYNGRKIRDPLLELLLDKLEDQNNGETKTEALTHGETKLQEGPTKNDTTRVKGLWGGLKKKFILERGKTVGVREPSDCPEVEGDTTNIKKKNGVLLLKANPNELLRPQQTTGVTSSRTAQKENNTRRHNLLKVLFPRKKAK